jgi:hypothetical protein
MSNDGFRFDQKGRMTRLSIDQPISWCVDQESVRMHHLKRSGLIGCLNGTGTTSNNYKGFLMNQDEWCRKRLHMMLLDFMKDFYNDGLDPLNSDLKKINDFIDKWVEKHFPFVITDEE